MRTMKVVRLSSAGLAKKLGFFASNPSFFPVLPRFRSKMAIFGTWEMVFQWGKWFSRMETVFPVGGTVLPACLGGFQAGKTVSQVGPGVFQACGRAWLPWETLPKA